MSQRQRRRRNQRRRQSERRGPSRRQVATGATIALGTTLAAGGSAQAATITVTNLNDTGDGSLRQALTTANTDPGSDDIVFASGLTGTINVGTDSNYGLYADTSMNVQGDGRITLQGGPNVDYVFYTGSGGSTDPVPITLSGLTITGGDATGKHVFTKYTDGGGIRNLNAALTVSDSVITNNYAEDDGGGIYSYTGPVKIVDSTLSGNRSGDPADGNAYGGGVYSQESPVVVRNTTVSGNGSGGDGAGIYMSSRYYLEPPLTMENSTVANNTAGSGSGDDGGGIWLCCGDDDQSLSVKSSTITGNHVGGNSGFGGGLVLFDVPAANVSIQSSIIANNTGTVANDIYSTYGGQLSFSLVKELGADSTDTGNSFTNGGPNLIGVDPQLGPLAGNGGTTETEAPSTGSPVIDAGASQGLTSDQRGVLRPIDFPAIPNAAGGDGSDIGAVEISASSAFKFGKLKRNKKKGTAQQVVVLPLPDAGSVTIKGKGLKSKTRRVTGAAKVKLPVIAKGNKRKGLNRTGKAKIKAKVIYNATGSAAKTLKRKLKLLKS